MRIGLSHHWRIGPPEPGTPIDWDSDHADGLVAFWPCWDGKGWCLDELVHGMIAKQKPTTTDLDATQPFWSPSTDFVGGNVPTISTGATGGNDAYYVPVHPAMGVTKFTLSCWCNRTTTTGTFSGPVSNRMPSQAGFMFVSENSGSPFRPHLTVINAAGTETQNKMSTTTFAIPFTTYHHFVWTYDLTTVRLWIDGKEDVLSAGAGGWTGHDAIAIGFAYNQFVGQIWDVRVYNRARPELVPELLDPGERWKIFQSTRARSVFRQGTATGGGKLAGFGGGLVGGGLTATSSPLVA